MPLTIKGKLSTCTMSNIIEYEYVIGGPLKGGQPASKGGRMLPPAPPWKKPWHTSTSSVCTIFTCCTTFAECPEQVLYTKFATPSLLRVWNPPETQYVTKSGKTLRMGFFAKIAIAIFINSTPLELTFVQVWDRSPVPFPRYSAFCTMTRELLNSRNYDLKALLCARMHSPYTTSARKSTMGGVCRSNALSERMATKTAMVRYSSACFSVPLEKKFC